MTTEMQQQSMARAGVLVRGDDDAYAVPMAVLDRHRVAPERREQFEAELRAIGGETPAADVTLYELPLEALAPYRIPDEARAELDAQLSGEHRGDDTGGFARYAPNQPKGEVISGYTGYAHSVTFGAFQRGASGHQVYIGVFPMFQMPSQGTPTDTIR